MVEAGPCRLRRRHRPFPFRVAAPSAGYGRPEGHAACAYGRTQIALAIDSKCRSCCHLPMSVQLSHHRAGVSRAKSLASWRGSPTPTITSICARCPAQDRRVLRRAPQNVSRRRSDARTQIDLIGAASIVIGLQPTAAQIGGYLREHMKSQVTLRDRLPVNLGCRPRLAEFVVADGPSGHDQVSRHALAARRVGCGPAAR
jgi:hypothetical protein